MPHTYLSPAWPNGKKLDKVSESNYETFPKNKHFKLSLGKRQAFQIFIRKKKRMKRRNYFREENNLCMYKMCLKFVQKKVAIISIVTLNIWDISRQRNKQM